MTLPLVSVIVPVHNGQRHIAETLHSVARQANARTELIIVDDASTDGTVETLRAISVAHRYIPQAQQTGVAAARNRGLEAASGEYVCFLDQDDLWAPEHVATQLAAFAQAPEAGVVVSPYQHWFPLASEAGEVQYTAADTLFAAHPHAGVDPEFSGWVYHQFLRDCWALTSATMIRRSVLERHGAFDPSLPFSEDWDLWLRLSREVRFVKLNGPPVLYRQHAVQGSRVARPVDHRTRLLLSACREHGLASRDGRAVSAPEFRRTIARYEMEFGRQHLVGGDSATGRRALWRSWRRTPWQWRPLALALASTVGWRPRDASPVS